MVASSLSTSDLTEEEEGIERVDVEVLVPKRGLSGFWGEMGIGVDLVDNRRIHNFNRANLGLGSEASGIGGVVGRLVLDWCEGDLGTEGIWSGNWSMSSRRSERSVLLVRTPR
jgi:hypothetical protein